MQKNIMIVDPQKQLKPLAFKRKQIQREEIFEDLLNNSNNESHNSYSSQDFGGLDNENDQKLELRKNSALKLLKIDLLKTYQIIQPNFNFCEQNKPRRNLTSPDTPVGNNGLDNEEFNLIVFFDDIINNYKVVELIGQGQSGQVFQVIKLKDKEDKENNNNDNNNKGDNKDKYYALKIIKNKKSYTNQSYIELKILTLLNKKIDKNDKYHIIRVYDYFIYNNHLCIVFELLNENLFQLLQHNHLQGISLKSIGFITKQILEAIEQIHNAKIIHCDLKPENILLKKRKDDNESSEISNTSQRQNQISLKVTDFGTACYNNNRLYTYIQSRYYRAPEIILGLPYTNAIDIWSIGLIAAELYLGIPLIPGTCNYDMLKKMETLFGKISNDILSKECKYINKYYDYNKEKDEYTLKNETEYYKNNPKDAYDPNYKIPFDLKSLDDLITLKRDSKLKKYKNNNSSNSSINNSSYNFGSNDLIHSFVHFLKCTLTIDPQKRFTATQCLHHPFITKEKFDSFIVYGNHNFNFDNSNINIKYFPNNNNNKNTQQTNNNRTFTNYNNMSYDMNNQLYNNNSSSNNNSFYCFQPNLSKIQMNWMNKFPYAYIENCNLQNNKQNNFIKKNNTFMINSQELNNSYNNNYYSNNSYNNNIFMNNNIYNNNANNSICLANIYTQSKFKQFKNNNLENINENSPKKNRRNSSLCERNNNNNYYYNNQNNINQSFGYERSNKRGNTINYPSNNSQLGFNNLPEDFNNKYY